MEKKSLKYEILDFIKDLLISFVIVLIIVKLIIFPCQVDGSSMYPTLIDGQIGFSVRISKLFKINRFDIAIIDINEESKKYLVKRVIGLPNETIEYKDNELYIDGIKYDEDFLDGVITKDFKVTLSDDEYYCLGDNRGVSIDSRSRGAFNSKQIIATHVVILFPLNEIRITK